MLSFFMKERVQQKGEKMFFLLRSSTISFYQYQVVKGIEETLASATTKWHYYLEVIL